MVKKSKQAYKNIREASETLDLQPHVLRFWESKFDMLRPMTRGGGRRYYSPDDMILLETIQRLVHEEGMTIQAANRFLKENGFKVAPAQLPSEVRAKPKTVAKITNREPKYQPEEIQELINFDERLMAMEDRAEAAISTARALIQKIRDTKQGI